MPKPSLVLVIGDDLVEADLTPERAPEYHALLGVGRRFARAYSMPVCSQSRACMLFGRYGRTLGIKVAMSATDGPEPPAGEETVAGLLRGVGYRTALVGKWHLGRNADDPTVQPAYIGAPQSRGYDTWRAGSPDNLDNYTDWLRVDDYAQAMTHEYATVAEVQAARAWWESTSHPRFLVLALPCPHAPFHDPPAELLGGYDPQTLPLNRRRYEKMVRTFDWALGQVRTFPGISNAVVCVATDNGTPVNVPGPGQDPERTKTTAYEGGCHVVTAWYGPSAAVAQGTVTNDLVHLVDIPATFLSLAGVPVPEGWDGVAMDLGAGNSYGLRSHVLIEADLGGGGELEQGVVSSSGLKLIRHDDGTEEAYDLTTDPAEAVNRVSDPVLEAEIECLRAILDG